MTDRLTIEDFIVACPVPLEFLRSKPEIDLWLYRGRARTRAPGNQNRRTKRRALPDESRPVEMRLAASHPDWQQHAGDRFPPARKLDGGRASDEADSEYTKG